MIVLATSNADKSDSETGCLHLRFHYHFYLCGDSHVEAPLGAEASLVVSCNFSPKEGAEALPAVSCNVAGCDKRNGERWRFMKRDRSQSMVIRGDRILLVEHQLFGRDFYNLPGGGIEEGETPEQAALRELWEECNVHGSIMRPLTMEYKPDMESRVFTFLVEIPEEEQPVKGIDPELSENEQSIIGVKWLRLDEISERDRAYLFGAGLMRVPYFHDEVLLWDGEDISYPGKKVFS